jgi:hypothetical protein
MQLIRKAARFAYCSGIGAHAPVPRRISGAIAAMKN